MSETTQKTTSWTITEYCSGTITVRTPKDFVCRCSNNEKGRKYSKLISNIPVMLDALRKIAEMEPGTSCDTDDGCSYYTSECGTCDEMISTAKEALKECGVGK